MTQTAYSISRNWKTKQNITIRLACKYSVLIYPEVLKRLKIALQFSGLSLVTIFFYLGLFKHWSSLRMQEGLACWPSVPDFSPCFSPNQWNAACWDQGDEHWLDKNSCSEENFSSQSYSCGRKVEVHRTKYSDLYCFVCKAAVIGAYLDSQVCHHPGYTQSCHAWSQHWRGACSSQGIPSRCKQMSDVLILTHPKNSTMLPKNTAMLLLYRLFTLPPGLCHFTDVYQQLWSHCIHSSSPSRDIYILAARAQGLTGKHNTYLFGRLHQKAQKSSEFIILQFVNKNLKD